jgi:hypothetical protein
MQIRLSQLRKLIRESLEEVAGIGPAGPSSSGGVRAFWTVAPQLNIPSDETDNEAKSLKRRKKKKDVLRRKL